MAPNGNRIVVYRGPGEVAVETVDYPKLEVPPDVASAMGMSRKADHAVILRNVSNWRFYALQFEEEREEGPKALPLEIDRSSNIQFANTFFYRVVSCFVPFPHAVKLTRSRDIRFRNLMVTQPGGHRTHPGSHLPDPADQHPHHSGDIHDQYPPRHRSGGAAR